MTRFEKTLGFMGRLLFLAALFSLTTLPALALQESQKSQLPEGSEVEDPPAKQKPGRRRVFVWDDGLFLNIPFKRLKLRVESLIQNDTAGFSTGTLGPLDLEDGAQWRRASISTDTTFPRLHLEFKFHYDFSANSPRLQDAYVGLIGLRREIFQVRAGRYKTPIGLENWTGTGNLTFLERGLISAFLSSRNSGILLHGDSSKRRIRWAFSVFQPEHDFGDQSTDTIGISGRFTSAFLVKPDVLTHLGINYLHRNVDNMIRFQERPESHLAPAFVDTGDFPADSVESFILEGAVVKGPLSFQAEYAYTAVRDDDLPGAVKFNGFYVFGSYFLTGETRPYLQDGRFGAITPLRELGGGSNGYGAFEIAFRVSHLDLSDKGVQGGVLNDLTAALNWYPTKLFRVMFNTIRAKRKGSGTAWIFQVRLQVAI